MLASALAAVASLKVVFLGKNHIALLTHVIVLRV